jgi:alkylated DNA repair dioxygenase AlkB
MRFAKMNNPIVSEHDPIQSLISFDGKLFLIPGFYQTEKADFYFERLYNTLGWQSEKLFIFGRQVLTPRLMAWYGDKQAVYRYSGVNHLPNEWTAELLQLKTDVETSCQHKFNSVLANLYRHGQDSMAYHADNEKELGENPTIASLNFGESRLIRFKHNKTADKLQLELAHGDLLIMAGSIQHHWKHEAPKTRAAKTARINLTFRQIIS